MSPYVRRPHIEFVLELKLRQDRKYLEIKNNLNNKEELPSLMKCVISNHLQEDKQLNIFLIKRIKQCRGYI